jgi:hypothetical protein
MQVGDAPRVQLEEISIVDLGTEQLQLSQSRVQPCKRQRMEDNSTHGMNGHRS